MVLNTIRIFDRVQKLSCENIMLQSYHLVLLKMGVSRVAHTQYAYMIEGARNKSQARCLALKLKVAHMAILFRPSLSTKSYSETLLCFPSRLQTYHVEMGARDGSRVDLKALYSYTYFTIFGDVTAFWWQFSKCGSARGSPVDRR